MGKYKVAWDNGASACGTFDQLFDTREEAELYGQEWADEQNMQDFGTTEPDEDGYSFDVVEADDDEDEEDES